MGYQLAIPGTLPAVADDAAQRFQRATERAAARVLRPHADATEEAYAPAWRRWLEHCQRVGQFDHPVEPHQLVAYLEAMAEEYAPNTVRLHLAALCAWDAIGRTTEGGPPVDSLRRHPVVSRWLKSWSRDHPRAPQRQAPALSVSQVRAVLAAAAEPRARSAHHTVRYPRDRCLVVWGILGGLRVSELVALELRDVMHTDRGLQLLVRRSKTDQHGETSTVALMPQGDPRMCPVEAWRQWRAVRGEQPGPVFLGIERTGAFSPGLTTRQVQRRMAELGSMAGVELLTPHSLRATFATLATERGRSVISIANQGRWRSLDTLRGYVRQGNLYRDNPSAGLLDGE